MPQGMGGPPWGAQPPPPGWPCWEWHRGAGWNDPWAVGERAPCCGSGAASVLARRLLVGGQDREAQVRRGGNREPAKFKRDAVLLRPQPGSI